MPIFAASAWITGSSFVSVRRVSATRSTFLQALALQVPLPLESYFDPFSAAFALATLPWFPAVPYGLYSASWLSKMLSGTMWFATSPIVGPPQACTRAFLSITQFIAWRTFRSSNGGWVMFMYMYQVRSPEFWWQRGSR